MCYWWWALIVMLITSLAGRIQPLEEIRAAVILPEDPKYVISLPRVLPVLELAASRVSHLLPGRKIHFIPTDDNCTADYALKNAVMVKMCPGESKKLHVMFGPTCEYAVGRHRMEWTGCGETPQTDEEELEGKIAAIDLRESMEKSKEFWGDTQFDDKFVITANLLKCPPCCDEHNIVAASQLAHIAWEAMSQCDLEEITKINRDLLLSGEIPTNYLIPKIDQILKNTMDINCMQSELQKVDSDYQQAVILVANQLLCIFDENIPPRIVEDDLEVNPSKKSAPPQTPLPNGNNAKNTPVPKDIKTRIKELMELALQNGLGEIKVPKAAYVNDRAKLAILEKQIKGRLRLKHIIESGASKTSNKSASEDLNKSLYHQGKGHKMLNLSKRLKSAKAMREKILSKVTNNISVDDQRCDSKEKLPKVRLNKSPHFTSNSQNNVISQMSASSSKSDAVYNASSINTGKISEEKIMANCKYSQPKLLGTEKNEEEQVFYSLNVNEPAKNLIQNYLQENNECDGKILYENEAELENVSARHLREPNSNSTIQSPQETRTCPELNGENDTTKSNSNTPVDKTDLTSKGIVKEKSYKSLEEHSRENFYLKNIQKHDLTLKAMTDAKDGGLSLKQKLLDLSPKAIIESASDISAIRDSQIYSTSQERSIRIKSELALKSVLENSREDLENSTGSFLKNLQSSRIDIQNSQEENIKADNVELTSINAAKSHCDSLNQIQISEFPVYNTITNNTNNTNKEDFSMRDAIKSATIPDDIINLPIIKSNKNLSLILRETMTQVHAKTNFILTAPPPTPFPKSCSQSFNRSDEFMISSANISSVNSTDDTGETILENYDAGKTECAYGETEDYEWLENINAEKIGELNDETIAEEERGGDADDENDFEFDFDVDDIIERNRFLEIEEIKRFKNQASTIETMNDLQLELEMINSEEKNIHFCQNDGNEQMHAQVLLNDVKNSVVNDKVECKYEQSPIVMTAVNESIKKETEKNDSLTKSPEDLDEKYSNDKLEIENVSEEVNKNYEEVGCDEETVEGEDKEEEEEESDEEDDDEDEDDEENDESESTVEDISSKSASEVAKSESGEIQTDSREESDHSLVNEEIQKTEESNSKGKKGRTSRGGRGDNSLLYLTVFLGVFTATYFSDFGRHIFGNAVVTSIKSNAISCLDPLVGRLMKFWQTPLLTTGALTYDFTNPKTATDSEFHLLVRLGHLSFKPMSEFIVAILENFSWTKLLLIYERDGGKLLSGRNTCKLMMETLVGVLKLRGILYSAYDLEKDGGIPKPEHISREIGNHYSS